MSTKEHKSDAPRLVTVGIITVSTTRSLAEDKSGQWMTSAVEKEGHAVVYHQVVTDDAEKIKRMVLRAIGDPAPQVMLLTGGTGISAKDLTIETIRPLFDKELTAFGALFAQQSFDEIGSAALLSRATAGLVGGTVLFCLPGSLKACQLACNSLILPELGHLVRHILKG